MKNLRSRLIMPADFLEKCKAVRSITVQGQRLMQFICFLFVWDWRHYILSLFSVGVNLFLRRSTPMCNENKDTARKEESHAEVTDSQRRNAPL